MTYVDKFKVAMGTKEQPLGHLEVTVGGTGAVTAADVGTFQARVVAECDAIARMLIAKNAAYGNSALDPVRIFSRADAAEQIRVRIDDKISRLQRGALLGASDAHSASALAGEDTVLDLIGYLILLRLAEKK